jgi:SpoIID/LytB domain protein
MSQYGANEAAKRGLKAAQILNFYYPGTTIAKLSTSDKIRVWIKADTDGTLNVKPGAGLRVKDASGKTKVLPTGSKYTQWRIKMSGSTRVLQYKNTKKKWVTYRVSLNAKKSWAFSNSKANTVKVVLPSTTRTYRGEVALLVQGKQKITVNTLKMEEYLRSVVPAEMPPTWNGEALKAQAVAARSYSARYRVNLGGKKVYDVCDTTACQAYKGTGSEKASTNAAITATAGQILKYKSQIAWTEFSSSNGGYSVKGSYPYIVAKADPYDLAAKQYWAVPITSATLNKKYKIGTLKSISVVRDGKGQFGGRVTSVAITGSSGRKTVSGTKFKADLGLRETTFRITGGLATTSATYKRWQTLGGSRGQLGIPTASEVSVKSKASGGTGLVAAFEAGNLYYSPATSARMLQGDVLKAYLADGGPAKSALGFPTSDSGKPGKQIWDFTVASWATFEGGVIGCPAKVSNPLKDCLLSYG